MYNAERMVKINACMKATNISITLINTTKGTETVATAIDLKMKIKQTKLNTKMWPAVMFANKRIIKANGLVNKPMISTGIINGYNQSGTCGVNTWLQYVLVPFKVVITNVTNANTNVTAIFPVT